MIGLRDRGPHSAPAYAHMNAQSISKKFQCSSYTEYLSLKFSCCYKLSVTFPLSCGEKKRLNTRSEKKINLNKASLSSIPFCHIHHSFPKSYL